jgi:sugar phosphate permease
VSGIYGAHSNLKRNLVLSLFLFFVTALGIALLGEFSSYYIGIFIFIKALVGIINAFIWPTIMTSLALWFPKKGRGIIVGIWATCNNVGHIGGAQISAALLKRYEGNWWNLSYTVAGAFFVLMLLCHFLLVIDPAELGFKVTEL